MGFVHMLQPHCFTSWPIKIGMPSSTGGTICQICLFRSMGPHHNPSSCSMVFICKIPIGRKKKKKQNTGIYPSISPSAQLFSGSCCSTTLWQAIHCRLLFSGAATTRVKEALGPWCPACGHVAMWHFLSDSQGPYRHQSVFTLPY